MEQGQYPYVEQDHSSPAGGGELPTYDDLAAQNGPNSRFGRWRGWIEKRAAERYADVTPEERARRRAQGWDLPNNPTYTNQPPPVLYNHPQLHLETNNLSLYDRQPGSPQPQPSVPEDLTLPFVSQPIAPSHLKINHFGSRFLPHATSPIRCILPLMGDRLVLIGHDEGLSVLDMFPQLAGDNGEVTTRPPNEAQSYLIWRGETIHQMTILELEDCGEGTLQGVVLALVGPEPGSPSGTKDGDIRSLRMYNLSSLTSLARWAVSQRGARPLDLPRASNFQGQQNSTPRKHRQQGSIARSIKSLIVDSSSSNTPEPTASYQSFLSSPTTQYQSLYPSLASANPRDYPTRQNSDESGWDVVDDLPLRWASDFVPLASPGSRLAGLSVISYATWADKNRRSTGGQLLAIATKNAILLYESPKGERAYRFVKEFYTPLQPKRLAFFDQLVIQDYSPDSPGKHSRSASGASIRPIINDQHNGTSINYGTQLSLFVVFEKKASFIRIADSAVGEFELADDGGPSANLPQPSFGPQNSLSPSISSMTHRTRSRLSFEIRESVAKWLLPASCELPVPMEFNQFSTNSPPQTRPVYLLTRGRRTHVLPCPLPSRPTALTPIHVIYWKNAPRNVSVRVCNPSRGYITAAPRFSQSKPALLQVVAFGEYGMEVYEATVLSLFSGGAGKGKGKAASNPFDSVRAEEDVGDSGFLAAGGNWDQADELYGGAMLDRCDSFTPSTATSFTSLESEAIPDVLKGEVGMYGWCRKGNNDYRIFWVGGSHEDLNVDDDDGQVRF